MSNPSLLMTDWDGVRDSLAQLAASHDQVASFLADLFGQLDRLWGDLARRQQAWRREQEEARRDLDARAADLDRQRAELAVERERLRRSIEQEAQERLRQAEQNRAAEEQDRLALETELEAVRARAAELAENIAQQQRHIAEERAGWTDELTRMRRALEGLVQHQAEPAAPVVMRPAPAVASGPQGGDPRPEPSRAAGSGEDPVLSSVMAQFEMLQRDLARRRSKAS